MHIVVVAPSAIVDHLAIVPQQALQQLLGHTTEQCLGGSRRVSLQQVEALLDALHAEWGGHSTQAAGSAPNVARTLAQLGGVTTCLVGTGHCNHSLPHMYRSKPICFSVGFQKYLCACAGNICIASVQHI